MVTRLVGRCRRSSSRRRVGEVLSHLRQLQARGLAAESDVDGVGMWTARAA